MNDFSEYFDDWKYSSPTHEKHTHKITIDSSTLSLKSHLFKPQNLLYEDLHKPDSQLFDNPFGRMVRGTISEISFSGSPLRTIKLKGCSISFKETAKSTLPKGLTIGLNVIIYYTKDYTAARFYIDTFL